MFPTSTASMPQMVDPAIVKFFDQSTEQIVKDLDYTKFKFKDFEVENINADEASSVSGFGAGQLTIQGAQYALDTMYNGYKKTLIIRKYTKRFVYSEELHYSIMKKKQQAILELQTFTKSLTQGLLYNKEQDWAKMFYLGQGTTFITGGDGVALFSASHPVRKPGIANQSNIVTVGATTNPVLNAQSLRTANFQMDRFLDDSGSLMMRGTNRTLVVPRAQLEDAYRIVVSEYGPDTANLGFGEVSPTIRTRSGYNITIKCLNHIPDAYSAYWFLVDEERMVDQVYMAKAWDPRCSEKMWDIDGSQNILASVYFGPNPIDWRWVIGSTGANALS